MKKSLLIVVLFAGLISCNVESKSDNYYALCSDWMDSAKALHTEIEKVKNVQSEPGTTIDSLNIRIRMYRNMITVVADKVSDKVKRDSILAWQAKEN